MDAQCDQLATAVGETKLTTVITIAVIKKTWQKQIWDKLHKETTYYSRCRFPFNILHDKSTYALCVKNWLISNPFYHFNTCSQQRDENIVTRHRHSTVWVTDSDWHTHTHNRLTAFGQDNPDRPVPEETLTNSHPSWSSDILYHLPPFTTIKGILNLSWVINKIFFSHWSIALLSEKNSLSVFALLKRERDH